jgi:FG-GAP-like repeat
MSKFFVYIILLTTFCLLAVSSAFSQVSFSSSIRQHLSNLHADFNSDGREDFISTYSGCAGFAIALSTSSGSYASPVCYKLPSGTPTSFAIGDFNGDGNPDLIVGNSTNTFYKYFGSSSGTLHLQSTVVTTTRVIVMAAGDINHNGKIDLVFAGADGNLHVWFGNGNGGFTAGPTTPIAVIGELLVGDFDGDGNADVLTQQSDFGTAAQLFYGDGTGHFTVSPDFGDDSPFAPYDVNGDGRMDLITAPFAFSTNGNTYSNILRVYQGNANRTFTIHQVNLANCTVSGFPPAVADFNGDGINDIMVVEGSDCQGSGPDTVNVLLGNPDGTYQPEQAVYTGPSTDELAGPIVLRANRDSKPDVVLNDFSNTSAGGQFVLLQNSTTGGFPSCNAPNRYTGITLCAPTSTVVASSPVKFSIGAANQTVGRKVEVWIDGKKMSQQLKHAFSYYSFLNASYSLAAGKHNVTVFSAGWDNLVEKFSFPLTVGSSTCAFPATAGVNVCSPLNNATLGSSVLAWASGTVTGTAARMEVWVDGAKKVTASGRTLKTTLSLGSGTHKFTYFIINTAGQKWQQTVFATVP